MVLFLHASYRSCSTTQPNSVRNVKIAALVGKRHTGTKGQCALGVSAAQLTVLDAVIDQLTDLNNQSRISQETETLNDTDKQRDNVAVYALNRINNSATLPLQAEQEAGKFLRNVVKPYTGIARLPLNQETGLVAAVLLIENAQPEAGTLYVIPRTNNSAFILVN